MPNTIHPNTIHPNARAAVFGLVTLTLAGCANDKTMHFVAGVAASKYVTQKTGNPLQGCAAALASGIVKELYDSQFGGIVDRYDALATGAGCMYTVRF